MLLYSILTIVHVPLNLRHPIFTPIYIIQFHILMVQKASIFFFNFTYIKLIKCNNICLWLCSFKVTSHLSNKVGWYGKKEVIQVSRNDRCSDISVRIVQFCIVLTKAGEILWYYCIICIMFHHAEYWYKVMTLKTVLDWNTGWTNISLSQINVNFFKHLWDSRYVMPRHLCSPILLCSTPQGLDPYISLFVNI